MRVITSLSNGVNECEERHPPVSIFVLHRERRPQSLVFNLTCCNNAAQWKPITSEALSIAPSNVRCEVDRQTILRRAAFALSPGHT